LRAAHFPEQLVNELLSAYCDTKHNFLLSGLRLSAVEGGRFCEAALRLLEHATTGSFTDLKRPLDSDGVIKALANSRPQHGPRSIADERVGNVNQRSNSSL
jgi:hypothetical protein